MPRFLLSHNMSFGKTSEKGIHMNIITSLLDIEDNDLELLSCEVQGLKKIVTLIRMVFLFYYLILFHNDDVLQFSSSNASRL